MASSMLEDLPEGSSSGFVLDQEFSRFSNSNCVEVAGLPNGGVAVRDSKDPSSPVLRFTPGEWHAFLGGVGNGEFDNFGR